MTQTDTLTDQEFLEKMFPYDESKEGNTLTHIINPPSNLHIWQPGMTAKDVVAVARITGARVVALCGYIWVPKKNPEQFPVCNKCIQIAIELAKEE